MHRRQRNRIGNVSSERESPRRTILLNKPYGILSRFTPEPGSRWGTLAEFAIPPDLYPLGRLDADSEGMLLLSNDQRLNSDLLHPRGGHGRTYLVQIERLPDHEALDRLRHGLPLDGRPTLPAAVRLVEEPENLPPRPVPIRYRPSVPTAWIELTLTEGRNRQVRRMTAAAGHPTLRLIRVAIGGLRLDWRRLPPGSWRDLTTRELRLLFDPPALHTGTPS